MRHHKKIIGVSIVLMGAMFPLTLLTGISNPHQEGLSGAKRDNATATQAGRMSEKQREHSKLYKWYKTEGNLRVRSESSPGDVEVVSGIPQRIYSSASPPFNFEAFLGEMTRKSDAVVIGVVEKKASFLTEDEDFIFSDYELNIGEILKNNSAVPIQTKSITVTRPGGSIMLGSHTIRAIDESLEPLALGNRYLLFLEFIPSTGAYKAFNSKGSFLLNGNSIVKLTHENLPVEMETGTQTSSLIAHIRSALQ